MSDVDIARKRSQVAAAIETHRLVPVISGGTPERARRCAAAVIEGGMRLLEITFTVPDAPEVIEKLVREGPADLTIGAGSVTNREQARMAIGAGAGFVVSPIRQMDLVPVCHRVGVPCILGALTPTEIIEAHRAGADQIKVFPIGTVGGPRYLQQVLGPLPGLQLMASGGVTLENFQEFLAAGARTVVLGSDLFRPGWLESGDFAAVTRRAREYLEARDAPIVPAG